jgi:hypothetical protein
MSRSAAGYYLMAIPVQTDGHGKGTLFAQPKVLAPLKAFLEFCFPWWSDGLRLNEEELSSTKITKRTVAGRIRTLVDHDFSLITNIARLARSMLVLARLSPPACLYYDYPLSCLVEKTDGLHRSDPLLFLSSD